MKSILNRFCTKRTTPLSNTSSSSFDFNNASPGNLFNNRYSLYGDIPYSEASKAYDEGIFHPKYDLQKDIYLDMLNELSEAAAGFDVNADHFGNQGIQDLIYEGDIVKWRKFAYSLMLRLAMRISNIDPINAQLYVSEAIEGGVFTSNDDNAWVQMANTGWYYSYNDLSGNFLEATTWQNPKLSETFIDFLRDHNDPRLMIISSGIGHYYGEKITDPALQKGMPNGKDVNSIRDYEGVTEDVDLDMTYSRVNELMVDYEDPALFQTYAEVEFLLAESAFNGWHTGDPGTHYNNGIRAAMQMYDIFDPSLTVSDTEVDTYLAAYPYEPDRGQEMIGTQYWAATFFNEFEAYANWRRTEYPVLVPVNYPGNHTNGTIPRRLIFNQAEVSKNEANYQAAVERMGGDELTTRVWWDGGN